MAAIMASDVDFGDNVYIEGVGYMPTEMYAQHLRMQGIESNQMQSEYLTVQEYLGKDGFNNATDEDLRLADPQVVAQWQQEAENKANEVQQTIKDPDKNLIPGIKDEYLIVGTIIAVIFLV